MYTLSSPHLRYTSLSRDELVFIYPSALPAECAVLWEVGQLEHSDLASNLRDTTICGLERHFPICSAARGSARILRLAPVGRKAYFLARLGIGTLTSSTSLRLSTFAFRPSVVKSTSTCVECELILSLLRRNPQTVGTSLATEKFRAHVHASSTYHRCHSTWRRISAILFSNSPMQMVNAVTTPYHG